MSERSVSKLLKEAGCSLQSPRKVHEGKADHPNREAQFQFIARQRESFQKAGHPTISVDTKKKELVGNVLNKGRDWRETKAPIAVNADDFRRLAIGKAAPYGVYDVAANKAFVNVGQSHDPPNLRLRVFKAGGTHSAMCVIRKRSAGILPAIVAAVTRPSAVFIKSSGKPGRMPRAWRFTSAMILPARVSGIRLNINSSAPLASTGALTR